MNSSSVPPEDICPTCKQLTGSWTVNDPRMWKEQCRVGDIAFQFLFVRFKGKPVPDWVTEGLPSMYHTLSEIDRLRAEVAALRLVNERLQTACDIFEKNSEGAMLLEQENHRLREELETLKLRNVFRAIESICKVCGHTETEDGCAYCIKAEIRKLREEN